MAESLLEQLAAKWAQEGWSPKSMSSFMMKEEEEKDPPEDPDDEEEVDDDLDDEDEKGKTALRKISQDRLTRMMKRERGKGRRSGVNEFVKELGFQKPEDLKNLVTKSKKSDDTDKSEAQRAREEADAEKAAAAKEREAAKRERFDTKVERKLSKAEINPARLEKAIKLMDLEDTEMDDDDIAEAVEEFREEYPEWFTSKDEEEEDKDKKKPRTPGTKVPGQPRKKGEPTAKDAARSRLDKRHPKSVSKS